MEFEDLSLEADDGNGLQVYDLLHRGLRGQRGRDQRVLHAWVQGLSRQTSTGQIIKTHFVNIYKGCVKIVQTTFCL